MRFSARATTFVLAAPDPFAWLQCKDLRRQRNTVAKCRSGRQIGRRRLMADGAVGWREAQCRSRRQLGRRLTDDGCGWLARGDMPTTRLPGCRLFCPAPPAAAHPHFPAPSAPCPGAMTSDLRVF